MVESFSMPHVQDQQALNLKRWEELCANPFLAGIETDPFGQIIMSPPPGFRHADFQFSQRQIATTAPSSLSDVTAGSDSLDLR